MGAQSSKIGKDIEKNEDLESDLAENLSELVRTYSVGMQNPIFKMMNQKDEEKGMKNPIFKMMNQKDEEEGMENPIFKIINQKDEEKGMKNPIFKIINQKDEEEGMKSPIFKIINQKDEDEVMENPLYKRINQKDEDEVMENPLYKRMNQKEQKIKIAEEFKRFEKALPCVLESNSEGVIGASNSCLEEIPIKDIYFKKENNITFEEIDSGSKNSITRDKGVSLDISVLFVDTKFKLEKIISNEVSSSSKSLLAKKIIYSINIKEKDIRINDNYRKDIKKIADNYKLNDTQKAEEIDKLFKRSGYYIPLTAYIGGVAKIKSEKMTTEEKKDWLADIKLGLKFESFENENSLEFKKKLERSKTFNILNRYISGGDVDNNNFFEWAKSVNLETANVVEYSNFTEILSFIDEDLLNSLEEPINIVKRKYERRRNYYNLIQDLPKIRGEDRYVEYKDTLRIGCYDESKEDITCNSDESFEMKGKLFSSIEKQISRSFPDIIVGIEIINKNNCGKFTLENPIKKNYLNIVFKKGNGTSIMKFDIKIYTLKFPK